MGAAQVVEERRSEEFEVEMGALRESGRVMGEKLSAQERNYIQEREVLESQVVESKAAFESQGGVLERSEREIASQRYTLNTIYYTLYTNILIYYILHTIHYIHHIHTIKGQGGEGRV
jgi:hypothetical protein